MKRKKKCFAAVIVLVWVALNKFILAQDELAMDRWSKYPHWQAHDESVTAMDVSDDNSMIATGSESGNIRIWNLETRKLVTEINGHEGKVNALKFVDTAKLLSIGKDKTIRTWSVVSGQEKSTLQLDKSFPCEIVELGNGKWLIRSVNEVMEFDGAKCRRLSDMYNAIAVVKGSNQILLGRRLHHTIQIFDLKTEEVVDEIKFGDSLDQDLIGQGYVDAINVFADETKLLVKGGSRIGTFVVVIDLKNKKLERTLMHTFKGCLSSTCVLPDEKYAAVAGYDFFGWSIESGELVWHIEGPRLGNFPFTAFFSCMEFNRKEKTATIFLGADDGKVYFWNLADLVNQHE